MGNMTKMVCPKCGGRVFDISKIPKERIDVSLKCPRCHNIVTIECSLDHKIKRTTSCK